MQQHTVFPSWAKYLYTAISRKVVGESARDNPEKYCGLFWVRCSSKKFERMAREAIDVCLRMLKKGNNGRFDNCSVRNSVLIISHITFRGCRVHIFSDNLSQNSSITERECHVCVTQSRKCNAFQTGSCLYNLSRPRQSFKTIPAWNYPILGRLVFFSLYFNWLDLFFLKVQRCKPAGSSSTASGVYFLKFRSVQQIQ